MDGPRRVLRKRTLAYAAGAALVVGGGIVALGPAAPWIIDNLADGQRVWRLGRIEIDGVSGSWLGALRAERVTITDEDGVWLEASDVSLDWRPQDLFGGGFRLDSAHIAQARILREPILTEKRASAGGMFDTRIDALNIDQIDLAEPVLGVAAQFSARFQLLLRDDALRTLDLNLQRTDSDADHAVVLYRATQDYALHVDIAGAPGGVLSRILGVPEQNVRIEADGDGDLQTGGAHYNGAIGAEQLLSGVAAWTPTRWNTEGAVRFDLLPGLQTLARRIGPSATLNASGARGGAFEAHAATPFFAVDLQGALDEAYELDGPAHFVATTERLSNVAREAPFELGAARLEGELRQLNGVTAIQAHLDAREMDILGRSARLSGSVNAALAPDRFTLDADLRAPDDAPALFAQARLRTELSFDRHSGRFSLDRATIVGDALALDAQGWSNGRDGEFSGEWRLRKLEAIASDLRGGANGRWRAFAETEGEEHIWVTTMDGAGANIAGAPEIVPQLLGRSPQLDAMFRYESGGITVSHARVDGAQLRAAATGRIVRGQADLALEASARGPLTLDGAEIAGAVDATGHLTGRIARPSLSAQAQLSSFTAAGVVVDQPLVNFTLAPAARAYVGQARVNGSVSGQAVTATSNISIADSALAMNDLVAQVGALEARGTANIAPVGLSANLALGGALDGLMPGVTGRILGDVALTPETVSLDAQIADARAGDLRIRAATLSATGPYRAIEARFDLRGVLRRAPLAFAGTATVSARDGATELRMQGEGELAGAAIATRAPINARWARGGLEARFDVAIADGAVTGNWSERGRALAGAVVIQDAPLASLATIWDETAVGRIDGRMDLASTGAGLYGSADFTLTDARFAGRQRGTLNMHVVGDLDPSRMIATIDAQSSDGLNAHFEANAPVTTSAAPIRIALARERRGRASWSVNGPADALWAAARLQDQDLTGRIEGEGELEFGAGYLSGDGQIEIIDGRFEDKLTGITLVDLDALVSVGERGVNIERFTASGPRGGRLTASGGSANTREGRIAVTLEDMWVANRPDARAQGSGQLTLAWEGLESTLSGNLGISQADINIAQNPEAGIPTLDVIEINRPGYEDETEEQDAAPSQRARATRLDVRVTAPGRIFTRGRGLEAEWSLDLRLAGTAAEPRVFGEANTVRGTIALSGQPFEIERGRIAFNGNPLNARIDLVAERDTADLTARISLSGSASDPEISLTSTPALPEDEILPQVLFGRSVEDLSALEAAQIAAALASLSGRASFDLVDAARAAAGLDRFNVRQDDSGGFLVAGGVYLTRDVYVEVARTGLGQAATRVEWTIRPRLVLITSFLGNNDQRVSLRWRRESD